MVIVETSFPRGGTVEKAVKTSNINFGARQLKKSTKKHVKKPKEPSEGENEEKSEIEAFSAELLSHKTIQEGMIVMGSVKEIDHTYLKISLPGRVSSIVLASNISDSYTKILNQYVESSESVEHFKPLNELYEIGQTVYAKVIKISEEKSGRLGINLSLKPCDVHSTMYHRKIRKGLIINGAVEEVQDHGYIIETGVKNLRCFLPSEELQTDYCIGQLVFMRVEKITHNPNASTAVCKAVKGENRKIKDIVEPNLDYIVPTSVVNFRVEKIVKDGLQGSIMNRTFKAYINEHQLHEPLASLDDFEVDSTLSARVLYTMPLTKLVYLSLNLNKLCADDQKYQKGDVIENAEVIRIGTGGVILKLDGKNKGLISFKSIKTGFVGNYDQDEILSKYVKSKKFKVRVIDFDQMDSLYICTDNPNIINEKYYTLADLKVGEFVTATVLEKQPNQNYILSIGNVRGLIEKIFLSSSSLHLPDNSKLRCRVMSVSHERRTVYLTNRPEYMSEKCKLLTQLSQAKERQSFLGTVIKVCENYLIVKFFNNIKGILYKNKIKSFMAREMFSFYDGQTMHFRIFKRDGEKIVLGLTDDTYAAGELCTAKVNSIIESGLDIDINDDSHMKALVPTRLLSDFAELVNVHINRYKPGDDIEVACIVKNIFSVRDVLHFKDNPPKSWRQLKAGEIIRGFIKYVDGDIVDVFLPLKDYEEIVKVHMKMFLQKLTKNENIVVYPDQVIFVKVLSTEKFTKGITVSAKLIDVWDLSFKTTANIFGKYLDELKQIKKFLKRDGNPMGSIELGQIVSAKVIGSDDATKDWFVELPNSIRGTIKTTFTAKEKSVKIGETLNCVILWIDYLNEMVYLSHNAEECDRITNDKKISKNYQNHIVINGKVLLKTSDVIVCSIKRGKNPVLLVPTRLHYNDFENSIANGVQEGEKCRLVVIHEERPIAVFENIWKLWNLTNNKKRKQEDNHDELATKSKKFKPLVMQRFPVSEVRITEDTSDNDDCDFKDVFECPKKALEDNEEEHKLAKLFQETNEKQNRKRPNSKIEAKNPPKKNKKGNTTKDDKEYANSDAEELDNSSDEVSEESDNNSDEASTDSDLEESIDQNGEVSADSDAEESEDQSDKTSTDSDVDETDNESDEVSANSDVEESNDQNGEVSSESDAEDQSEEEVSADSDEEESDAESENVSADSDAQDSDDPNDDVATDSEDEESAGSTESEAQQLKKQKQNKNKEKIKHSEIKTEKSSDKNKSTTPNDKDAKVSRSSALKKPSKKAIKSEKELDEDGNILEEFKKDMMSEKRKNKSVNKPLKPVLPGATGFWLNDLQALAKSSENRNDEESSADDDDDDTTKSTEIKKKKKLTPAERFRAAREEEARLREIEDNYANPNMKPETADQFDRLVLANPNSSKVWIEYMVFHLTATEIDKARTVGRKALKSISFREEQELINIWVALLNLELRYGTKESFNDTLKESLLSNDSFKIYCRVIQILTDAQKSEELSEVITTVTKKFRDNPETWRITANAYFDIGMAEKAKQLLHKALASLPERDHINTIVTFANLNHKHGDKETAHTLLEQILTSYPKRVDVWSQYVDMLVKDKDFDSARGTLERAVVQKLPLKKMRTLFKKYLDFEERHGTEENVQKVKEMAANYVQKEIS